MKLDLSVIIPCLNESEMIGATITAVSRELTDNGFDFEIIVVDNGSTDGSDAVATSLNANVVHSGACTIAGVRNLGAEIARGEVLVFLDADIVVQPFWGKALKAAYGRIVENNDLITGSHPRVPENIQPALKSWYLGISEDLRDTHLGTGHMVLSKNAFRKVGGFEKIMVAGEDYDFCYRARRMGMTVRSNPAMVVTHFGFPNSLIKFAKREIWHGEGDCRNMKTILHSRVAICSAIFLILNCLMILSMPIHLELSVTLFASIIIIAFSVNLYKFGWGDGHAFFRRSYIAYFYLMSRGLSIPIFMMKSICRFRV